MKLTGTVSRKWVAPKGNVAEVTLEIPLEAGAKYPERLPFKAFGDLVAAVKAAGEGEQATVTFAIRHRKKLDADKNTVQVGGRDFYETTLVLTGLLIEGGKPEAAAQDGDDIPF